MLVSIRNTIVYHSGNFLVGINFPLYFQLNVKSVILLHFKLLNRLGFRSKFNLVHIHYNKRNKNER